MSGQGDDSRTACPGKRERSDDEDESWHNQYKLLKKARYTPQDEPMTGVDMEEEAVFSSPTMQQPLEQNEYTGYGLDPQRLLPNPGFVRVNPSDAHRWQEHLFEQDRAEDSVWRGHVTREFEEERRHNQAAQGGAGRTLQDLHGFLEHPGSPALQRPYQIRRLQNAAGATRSQRGQRVSHGGYAQAESQDTTKLRMCDHCGQDNLAGCGACSNCGTKLGQ